MRSRELQRTSSTNQQTPLLLIKTNLSSPLERNIFIMQILSLLPIQIRPIIQHLHAMLKMLLVDIPSTDMMAGLFGSDIASNRQDAVRDVEDAVGGDVVDGGAAEPRKALTM